MDWTPHVENGKPFRIHLTLTWSLKLRFPFGKLRAWLFRRLRTCDQDVQSIRCWKLFSPPLGCHLRCNSWNDVELIGKRKLSYLRRFLKLKNGIRSHDTFCRVFNLLNNDQMCRALVCWLEIKRISRPHRSYGLRKNTQRRPPKKRLSDRLAARLVLIFFDDRTIAPRNLLAIFQSDVPFDVESVFPYLLPEIQEIGFRHQGSFDLKPI